LQATVVLKFLVSRMSSLKEIYSWIVSNLKEVKLTKNWKTLRRQNQTKTSFDFTFEKVTKRNSPVVLLRRPSIRKRLLSFKRPKSDSYDILAPSISNNRRYTQCQIGDIINSPIYKRRSTLLNFNRIKPNKASCMEKIRVNDEKSIKLEDFRTRLKEYNNFFQNKPEALREKQNKNGELVVDGLLNIYWGIQSTLRLQVSDKKKLTSRLNRGKKENFELKKFNENVDSENNRNSNYDTFKASKDTLSNSKTRHRIDDFRRAALRKQPSDERKDDEFRPRSVVMRKSGQNRIKNGRRASINGHYYNQETAVFTPVYGSVTKVRVNSTNDAHRVISRLFQKFKIENDSEEFSLFLVKDTQELRKLPGSEFPLLTRVLSGPNENISKLFIMEKRLHTDITQEVAQFMKMDPNLLRVFITKYREEEEKEIDKMKQRFEFYKKMIEKYINKTSDEEIIEIT